MTIQEHRAQGHEAIYLACKACWADVTLDSTPDVDEPVSAPVTYAEARGMEQAIERLNDAAPSASGLCRRCGTYCYGDCRS